MMVSSPFTTMNSATNGNSILHRLSRKVIRAALSALVRRVFSENSVAAHPQLSLHLHIYDCLDGNGYGTHVTQRSRKRIYLHKRNVLLGSRKVRTLMDHSNFNCTERSGRQGDLSLWNRYYGFMKQESDRDFTGLKNLSMNLEIVLSYMPAYYTPRSLCIHQNADANGTCYSSVFRIE